MYDLLRFWKSAAHTEVGETFESFEIYTVLVIFSTKCNVIIV